jgi:hypothetical protein
MVCGLRFLCFSTVLLAVFASACGTSASTTLTPTSPSLQRCAVTLDPAAATVTSSGGTGTIKVAIARECQWTLRAEADWVKVGSAMTGQGPAEISFSVEPNRSTSPRALELTVSGQRTVISQQAAICHWTVSPVEMVIGPEGGEKTVKLATEEFCSWAMSPSQPWIAIAPDLAGTGSAELTLRIARNEGDERSAIVEVPGGTISVRQREAVVTPPPVPPRPPASTPPPAMPLPPDAPPPVVPPVPLPPVVVTPGVACTYDVNPPVVSDVAATGTLINVDVTSQAGCDWSAASSVVWIGVATGNSGTGSGRVGFSVAENSGAARSATLRVAGRDVLVHQRAASCSYSVTPPFISVSSKKRTRTIDVTTQVRCSVTARIDEGVSWMRVASAPASGSGEIEIRIEENKTRLRRTAGVIITGKDFTTTIMVTQDDRDRDDDD